MAISVVSTGGTIASVPDEGNDASPSLDADDLIASIPGLEDVAVINTHSFSNVPSPHFSIRDMYELVEYLEGLSNNKDTDGIVVTQGTDILEETTYFVDLCYQGDVPVIFTGAMRNPALASPDGPGNLLSSVKVASDCTNAGVFIVFNDRILTPLDATKTHSMALDTFQSPEFGPLGFIEEDRVYWHRNVPSREILPVDKENLTSDIPMFLLGADIPKNHLDVDKSCDAVCVAATGAGHIPPSVIPALEDISNDGIPIIATTRCPEGRLARNTYGFKGSEKTLQELGCYYSALNLQKTRIKTIVAVSSGALDSAFLKPEN